MDHRALAAWPHCRSPNLAWVAVLAKVRAWACCNRSRRCRSKRRPTQRSYRGEETIGTSILICNGPSLDSDWRCVANKEYVGLFGMSARSFECSMSAGRRVRCVLLLKARDISTTPAAMQFCGVFDELANQLHAYVAIWYPRRKLFYFVLLVVQVWISFAKYIHDYQTSDVGSLYHWTVS